LVELAIGEHSNSTEMHSARNRQSIEGCRRQINPKISKYLPKRGQSKEENMLEIVAQNGTQTDRQAGGFPSVATIPIESSRRIILPRRSGESRFGPRQYWYPASKSGVVPSPPLAASRVSQRDESSDDQLDAA
jgi:hypothetical protein